MSLKSNFTANAAYQAQQKGETDKAKSLYEEAMADGLNRPEFIDAYGVLLMREGNFTKAIEIFGEALKMAPAISQRYTIRIHRAIAYMKTGDMKRARVALEDVYRKLDNERIFETLGYFYILTDDEKAREFNEKAINMYPENVTILDNIGQYYLDRGHPEIAKEFLEDAYKLDKEKLDVNFHLAKVAQSEGNINKALDYVRQAKECPESALNDTSPEDIEKLMDELKGL